MTILITKGQANTFAVTLTELADADIALNWLFRFNKDQGDREYVVFLTDVSPHPERYNEFELSEGDQTGDDLEFIDIGDYKYQAYQMPDTDDMDYTRGILVEIGKARILQVEPATVAYETTINQHVYKPE